MLQRKGTVLESRMTIRDGKVPRIARFRKEADVREPMFLHHLPFFFQYREISLLFR